MLTEEQKNHSHGLQIDLFSFNLDRWGKPLTFLKYRIGFFPKCSPPLGAANYSILTRGETAERILFVSLLKKETYEHDEAACDIFRSTVSCRRP